MKIAIDYHINAIRSEQKLSLRALSEKSGVSKSQIDDIENGIYHPTVYTLCLLSLALQVNPEKLFTLKIIEK